MGDFISAISNVGFPICVAVFLLIRIDPAIRELSSTLRELQSYMEGRDSHGQGG